MRKLIGTVIVALVLAPAATAGAGMEAHPAMATALAIAGAPASTPVSCTTSIPFNDYGWAQWSPDSYILLQPNLCNGLVWLESDGAFRFLMGRMMPNTIWPATAGIAALVALHESTHIAGNHDETNTECTAMSELPGYLARYLSGPRYQQALNSATAYDMFLPPQYHEHSC